VWGRCVNERLKKFGKSAYGGSALHNRNGISFDRRKNGPENVTNTAQLIQAKNSPWRDKIKSLWHLFVAFRFFTTNSRV